MMATNEPITSNTQGASRLPNDILYTLWTRIGNQCVDSIYERNILG